jgi:hypothetical protein
MTYNLIQTDSVSILTEKVSELLNYGWKCQGGVCVIQLPQSMREDTRINLPAFWFMQALIYEDNE